MRRLTSVLILLSLIACDSTTDPGVPLTIAVTAATGELTILPADGEGPKIQCPVTFEANASGSTEATALWQGAVFRWYFGPDSTAAVDSLVASSSELSNQWDADRIAVGHPQQSTWSFWGTAPFRMTAEFEYLVEPGKELSSVRAQFNCGPVPSQSAAAPTVSILDVSPDSSDVEPGDSLEVTYSASSSLGLWQTVVRTSGAFEHSIATAEEYRTSTTRTVRLAIPSNAQLGEEVEISVNAQDIGLQWGKAAPARTFTIVDRTPPTLLGASTEGSHLAGRYAPGDSLRVRVSARDNHEVRAIVVELGEPANARDSVIVSGFAIFDQPVALPVRPEWIGSPVLRVYARDAAGNKSETLASLPDSILIYPNVDGPVRSATMNGASRAVIHDPARNLLFLGAPDSARLNVLALKTMTLLPTISLPSGASGGDLSPSGDSLVLALPDARAFAIVDLDRLSAPPSVIPLTADTTGEFGPVDLRTLANGKVIAVIASSGDVREEVIEVDLSTGEQRHRSDVEWRGGGGLSRYALGRSIDHSNLVLYFDGSYCAQRYTSATDRFGPCQPIQWTGPMAVDAYGRISADYTGSRFLIVNGVYGSDLHLTHLLPDQDDYLPTVIAPDGESAYLSTLKGVVKVRTLD
ncbi:MAG TPA: hypothetical protein VFI96_07245, partial [Longimicrobiaceae bacterium]|nr:hypothetical protein [Longimicrobiaceae bacterium]